MTPINDVTSEGKGGCNSTWIYLKGNWGDLIYAVLPTNHFFFRRANMDLLMVVGFVVIVVNLYQVLLDLTNIFKLFTELIVCLVIIVILNSNEKIM